MAAACCIFGADSHITARFTGAAGGERSPNPNSAGSIDIKENGGKNEFRKEP